MAAIQSSVPLLNGPIISDMVEALEIYNENEMITPPLTPDSAIPELQSALGLLLLSRKEFNANIVNISRPQVPFTSEPSLPTVFKHEGPFRLLDLPREIREGIYTQYLYRADGIYYQRAHGRTYPDNHLGHTISLFLACRQIYSEAYPAFLRCNMLHIPRHHCSPQRYIDYPSTVSGLLRLFPAKAAAHVRRITFLYREPEGRVPLSTSLDELDWSASRVFSRIVEDSHTFMAFFPLLKVFNARWGIRDRLENLPGLAVLVERDEELDDEERTRIWKKWMAGLVGRQGLRREMRLELFANWIAVVDRQEGPVREAYERLAKEVSKRGEVDVDGKKWLEEVSKRKGDEWWCKKRRRRERREALGREQ